jgi:hypothetical protein
MALFTRDEIQTNEDLPGIQLHRIGAALIVWLAMQDERQTVGAAAHVFNTSKGIIHDAIGSSMWIFIQRDANGEEYIELDGE